MLRSLFFLLLSLWSTVSFAGVAEPGSTSYQGVDRAHYLYLPQDAGRNTPLVIALHGMGGNAANLRFGIGLTEEMERLGAAVVYPQGLRLPQGSRHWNAGFDYMEVDDLGYLTSLANKLRREHGLSQETVILGISMGGYMAYHMACHSELSISAIVVVAGSMHPSDTIDCRARPRASLLHIHGEQDPLIPFRGGGHWSDPQIATIGVPEVVSRWASQGGADPVRGVVDHDSVQETRYLDRRSGLEVQLLKLPAFGHDWPSEATAGYRAMNDIRRFIARQISADTDERERP